METLHENFIDVTLIEPKLKHPTIFQVFDSLVAGESLVIHNDHDPKPVYYQLLGERGDIFKWQYLQHGPEWWDVQITRNGEEDQETIGQIAARDLRKAAVFKKYGIDFCCGGKKTIGQVCGEKNIDATQVETELSQIAPQNTATGISYGDWSLDFLVDYIVNKHHAYVRKYLPELNGYALKVSQVHGVPHPELKEIYQLVNQIYDELTEHLVEEENYLFKMIKAIVLAKDEDQPIPVTLSTLEDTIEVLENEHEFVGKCFDEIRQLSGNYVLPADACTSYKLLFKMLQEFEDDLHLHIHLENNILFPKAIEMEKSLAA